MMRLPCFPGRAWVAAAGLLLAGFPGQSAPGATAALPPLPRGLTALEAPGVHNLIQLGPRLFSGSSPEGDEGFATLARLGVRTLISVDGAKPDVEAARRHGLRYVHLPHGYDGIATPIQLRLIQAARALPGPLFVHCHHGKHRGPAAAAVICLGTEGWEGPKAEAYMRAAGTSPQYSGLYDVVRRFRPPTPDQLLAPPGDFPETARVSGLVESMVEADLRWEHLQAIRRAGYGIPKEHPDLVPASEAVLLGELYREARRMPDAGRFGPGFIQTLESAEKEVGTVETLLRQWATRSGEDLRARLDEAFDAVGRTCAACHRRFRDPASNGDGRSPRTEPTIPP